MSFRKKYLFIIVGLFLIISYSIWIGAPETIKYTELNMSIILDH